MNALTPFSDDEPEDPARLGYPPTLPVEVALRVASVKDICASYGLSHQDWLRLTEDPIFRADLAGVVKELKKEGMSFKMKARLQSEELLKTSWKMIHSPTDEVPASVKADLLKFTVRAAGLDGSKDQAANGKQGTPLQIQINLR
jgi:hypothetical protein